MTTYSRREVLKLLAATAAAETFHPGWLHWRPRASPALSHALFFDVDALRAMRRLFVEDGRFADLREQLTSIDRKAERRFISSEVRLNDQFVGIARLGTKAEQLAFLYLMKDDEDAADLAADCIRTMMKFPRWDFFLEARKHVIGVQRAPSSTIAVSLVSDWLGNRISSEERTEWLGVMAERGCEACYRSLHGIRYPAEVAGWSFDDTSTLFEHRPGNLTDLSRRPEITQTTNLRAIPAAALAIGALAMKSQLGTDERVERWMEMAVHSLAVFEKIFKPDGSYHEGVGYANYTALHLAKAITALNRAGGADLSGIVNWSGYVDYLVNMSMPTSRDPYGIVNFGDNGNPQTGERGRVSRTAVPYWIARNSGNPSAQWFGNDLGGTADMWSLVWFDPAVSEVAPTTGARLWHSDLDWVVARSGFEVDDLVVALRSGGPANHEHADRNSIIVKCFGEQLFTDPNRPPYSFADPAWMMRTTAGHTAILIDGQGHEHHNGVEGTNASRSHARILKTDIGEDYASVTSDASQPYRLVETDIASVVRSVVVFFHAPAVVVVDRVTKHRFPSTVQARFFGYNWDDAFRYRLHEQGFVMERPGAVLHAQTFSRSPTALRAGRLPIPEERARRHPFVEIYTPNAETDVTLVTAAAIGRTVSNLPDIAIEHSDDDILVSVRSNRGTFACTIDDADRVPTINVRS